MFNPTIWGIAVSLVAPGVRDVASTQFVFWACQYAAHRGFRITATTNGRHNPGSKHGRGLAIDVSVRGKSAFELARFAGELAAWGWRLRDERTRPKGQAVWGGPHWHVEAIGNSWQHRLPYSRTIRAARKPRHPVSRVSPSSHRRPTTRR